MTAASVELDPIAPQPRIRRSRSPWLGLTVRPVLLIVAMVVLYLIVSRAELDSIEARYINGDEIRSELFRHIELSVYSAFFVVIIAVPLGILLTRRGRGGCVRSGWVSATSARRSRPSG